MYIHVIHCHVVPYTTLPYFLRVGGAEHQYSGRNPSNRDTNGTKERAYFSEVCLFQGLENWFLGKEEVARVSLEMVPLQWNLLIWTPMGQKKVKRCPCFRGYKQLLLGGKICP